jgi:hypothetical protein
VDALSGRHSIVLLIAASLASGLIGCEAALPAPKPTSTPAVALRGLIENVSAATAYRYGLTDDRGHVMDASKIIWIPEAEAFAAVYHSGSASDPALDAHLATSRDLMSWTWRVELASDASMPTIRAASDGGYVVAWDPTAEGVFTAPVLDYYATWDDVLADVPTKTFAIQLSLSTCGEGTVNLYAASSSSVDYGFHLYDECEVDRQGHGTSDWTTSTATRETRIDDAVLVYGATGGIGDRDAIQFRGTDLTLVEVQEILGDWTTFRVYLYDPTTGTAGPLDIRSHHGARSFTNPTIEQIKVDGQQAILVTLFVPQEGAEDAETGELIYYRTIEP